MNGPTDDEASEEVQTWSPERAGVNLGPVEGVSVALAANPSSFQETPDSESASTAVDDRGATADLMSDPWSAVAAGVPLTDFTNIVLFGDPNVWESLLPRFAGEDERERTALLLRQIEWVMWRDVRSCLACGREQEQGHTPDCPLAAALAGQ